MSWICKIIFIAAFLAERAWCECQTGAVRLSGGSEGRVEVCVKGQWGTVCADSWGQQEAHVVCRQLGYSGKGATASRLKQLGPSSNKTVMKNVKCEGSEKSLYDCPHSSNSGCFRLEDASVNCLPSILQTIQFETHKLVRQRRHYCVSGSLRLVEGTSTSGILEICDFGEWKAVCDNGWIDANTKVACRQLGHSTHGATFNPGQTHSNTIYGVSDVSCEGSENYLVDCNHKDPDDAKCRDNNYLLVTCQPFKPCINQLHFMAFTSTWENAQSRDLPIFEISLKNGTRKTTELYEYHTVSSDKAQANGKGDLWYYNMSSFGFQCILFEDISGLALLSNGNDGWNIESAYTLASIDGSNEYALLSADTKVYRWIDGNLGPERKRFDLSLVNKLSKPDCDNLNVDLL